MFEDSMVESSVALGRRNPWTTALSFAIQGLLASVLVLLPLICTQPLPWRQMTSILTAPAVPPPPAPLLPNRMHGAQPRPTLVDSAIHMPNMLPKRVAMLHDEATNAVESNMPQWTGVPGGIGPGVPSSLMSTIVQAPPAMPKVVAPSKVRVSSGVAQGLLIHELKPIYPTLAAQARIQGTVVLQAVIAKDGRVEDLRVVSGHPMLVKAALDAVKLWRYKPYLLNDQPVEVDTQINVNFTLADR